MLAQFIQSEEQAVGINVTLDPTDPTTLNARENSGAYQTCSRRDHAGQERPRLAVRQLPRDQRATVQLVRLFEPARDARSREQPQGGEREGPEDRHRRRAEAVLADRPWIVLDHILNRAAFSNKLAGVQVYPDQYLRVAFAGWTAPPAT